MTQRKNSAGFHSDSPALSDAFTGYSSFADPDWTTDTFHFPHPAPCLGSHLGLFLWTRSSRCLAAVALGASAEVLESLGLIHICKMGSAVFLPRHSRWSGDAPVQQTDRQDSTGRPPPVWGGGGSRRWEDSHLV